MKIFQQNVNRNAAAPFCRWFRVNRCWRYVRIQLVLELLHRYFQETCWNVAHWGNSYKRPVCVQMMMYKSSFSMGPSNKYYSNFVKPQSFTNVQLTKTSVDRKECGPSNCSHKKSDFPLFNWSESNKWLVWRKRPPLRLAPLQEGA